MGTPSVKTGPVELSLWTMQLAPFHSEYVLAMLGRFESLNPGTRVKWVDVSWAEMERKVLASLAAGAPPDVVNLNPQFSARLAELGALEDPRAHLRPDEWAGFLPAAWQANHLGGRPFALPWYLSTTVNLVRLDLLRKAGVDPPSNFDDLRQAAHAVRERVDCYAWWAPMDGSLALESLAAMIGPLISADGCRPAFDSEDGQRAFAFQRDLYQQRWTPPAVLTEGHRGAVQQFLAGQVAIVPTGMQFIAQLKHSNPGLHQRLGVTPQLVSGGSKPNIAAMNLAVLRASGHPERAMRLAQFICSAENQLELTRRVPVLPSTRQSYDDPWMSRSTEDPLLDGARLISIRQLHDGKVLVPPLRHYPKLRASFVRQLQLAMTGRISPQQAIDAIARVWVPLLGCKA